MCFGAIYIYIGNKWELYPKRGTFGKLILVDVLWTEAFHRESSQTDVTLTREG